MKIVGVFNPCSTDYEVFLTSVIEDINNSYDTIHRVKIFFSISSIGISCIIISIILFILLFKLDYYNEVLAEIVLTFDKTMINYV